MDRGSSEAKRIRAEYDAEIEAINHLIKTEGRPGLDSELRALKERLVEYSGVLEKICKSILPIFQVWIVETEREILRGRCEDDLSSKERTEVHYTRHKLYRSAADLWKNIVRGRPRENIEKGMHDKLNHEYTPDGLAEAQIYGVTPLMNHREIILKQSAPFHRRWRMCEFAQENFLRSGILGTIRTSRISMKDGKAILPPLHSSGAADAEKQPEPRGRKQTHVMKAMKATLEREGADDFEDAIKKVVETEGFKYANARRAFYRYLKALKERTGSRPSDTTELLELLRRVFPAE